MSPGTDIVDPLQTLDDYAATGDFVVLQPTITIAERARSEVLVESISVVSINPSKDAGEVYHDFRYANERDKMAALSQLGLGKIAAAAGIKWIPDLCQLQERQRREDGHVYVRFRAGAGLRQANGEWHIETATKAIDTADVAEQLEDSDRRSFDRMAGKSNAPAWIKGLPPDAADTGHLERVIEGRVKQQLMQLREHIESHAETKAKSRVIRRILSLKQTYSMDELRRPFAVPRLLYRPDLADPLAIEQVQMEGRQATDALFGAPRTTPVATAGEPSNAALPSPGVPPSPATQSSDRPSAAAAMTDAGDPLSATASPRATTPLSTTTEMAETSEQGAAGAGAPQRDTPAAPPDDDPTEVEVRWAQLVALCAGDVGKARRTVTKAVRRTVAVTSKNEGDVTPEELEIAVAWLQEEEGR